VARTLKCLDSALAGMTPPGQREMRVPQNKTGPKARFIRSLQSKTDLPDLKDPPGSDDRPDQ